MSLIFAYPILDAHGDALITTASVGGGGGSTRSIPNTTSSSTFDPLTVLSTVVVANLNASFLEGHTSSFFANASNITEGVLRVPVDTSGNVSASQLISNAPLGMPPLVVQSETVVPNLNASFLEGYTSSFFANASNVSEGVLRVPVDTVGNVNASQLISNAPPGTPPLAVRSKALVSNLNVNFLEGCGANFFANASNITGGVLQVPVVTTGNVTANYLFGNTTFLDFPASNRNYVMNGAMIVRERTKIPRINGPRITSVYLTDRWRLASFGTASEKLVGSTQNDGPATFDLPSTLRVTVLDPCVMDDTSFAYVTQTLDTAPCGNFGWGTSTPKNVTLSFWGRASIGGTYSGAVTSSDESRSFVFTFHVEPNVWKRYEIPIPGDASAPATGGGGWPLAAAATTKTSPAAWQTSAFTNLIFTLGAGKPFDGIHGWQGGLHTTIPGCVDLVGTRGASFELTGVQLEEGASATPYEHVPYVTELARCLSFYESRDVLVSGLNFQDEIHATITFSMPKRRVPELHFGRDARTPDGKWESFPSGLFQHGLPGNTTSTIYGAMLALPCTNGDTIARGTYFADAEFVCELP